MSIEKSVANSRLINELIDLENSRFSEDFLERLHAYEIERDRLLKILQEKGLIVPGRTTLPPEIRQRLMEKHGVHHAVSGFGEQKQNESEDI